MEQQKAAPGWAVDILFTVGALLISVGIGLWSLPGGLVTAGVFCLAGSVLVDLSAREPTKKDGESG